MKPPRWVIGIAIGAAITAALYQAGLGGPVVYVIRGVALHFFYTHGGGR